MICQNLTTRKVKIATVEFVLFVRKQKSIVLKFIQKKYKYKLFEKKNSIQISN